MKQSKCPLCGERLKKGSTTCRCGYRETLAEQELLRANPYTEKVTEHQISFTLAFKEAFWRLSVEGCTGNMALRKLGYHSDVLRWSCMAQIRNTGSA